MPICIVGISGKVKGPIRPSSPLQNQQKPRGSQNIRELNTFCCSPNSKPHPLRETRKYTHVRAGNAWGLCAEGMFSCASYIHLRVYRYTTLVHRHNKILLFVPPAISPRKVCPKTRRGLTQSSRSFLGWPKSGPRAWQNLRYPLQIYGKIVHLTSVNIGKTSVISIL